MRTIIRSIPSLVTRFWYLTLLTVFFSFSALAADPATAPPAKKAAKPQPAAATKATKSTGKPAKAAAVKVKAVKVKPADAKSAKAGPKPAGTSEEEALTSFEVFTIDWMNKLIQTEDFQRTQQIKITESPNGVTAEYVGYLPQRSIWVKKTKYDHTPFTGTLSYYERTMRCVGKTKEEAVKGPFEQGELRPVSEIFRFTKGKWVY